MSASRSEVLTPRFDDALVYASQLHRSQQRKGGDIPYVSHLLAVAAIVLEHGGDEDEAIAALLHDAIEDQGNDGETAKEIQRRFGDGVHETVIACSDTDKTPKPPWRERKEAYAEHLRRASRSVRLVSGADKLHNARSIVTDYREHGEALWTRFNASKTDTQWYYCAVLEALRAGGETSLVRELAETVSVLKRLGDSPRANDSQVGRQRD